MSEPAPQPALRLRQLLHRRELAATRHRSAVSRQLGLSETEMLAVAHLAQRGQLSPSELGELLDLSSGGVSALVQRLGEAGHVLREAHPSDGRRNLVRLAPPLIERAARALDPLVRDLDDLADGFREDEQRLLRRWLEGVVALTEQHAVEAGLAGSAARGSGSAPVPSLWG